MIQTHHFSLRAVCAATAVLLSACGGGGSSSGSTATLSGAQALLQEMALTSNGGMYSLDPSWTTTGLTTNLSRAQASKLELASSPAGVAAGVLSTYTVGIDLINTLPTPAANSASNANFGGAFIDGGNLYFSPAATATRITYTGNDILSETNIASGQNYTKIQITAYTKVPLSGAVSAAPVELQNIFRPFNSYIKPATTFNAGAAYYQRFANYVGEHVFVADADSSTTTNPQSATPLATGSTIEQYAAANPTLVDLTYGSIRTAKGARCWVNAVSGRANISTGLGFTPAVLPTYGALCQVGANLYRASVAPDGAVLGHIYATGTATSPLVARYGFSPRFNKAAYDTFRAAVN